MECQRCGIREETKAMQKYAARTGKVWCESCRTPRRRFVVYEDGRVCEAWLGDFDAADNPMKDGQPYLVGVRTCGHSDCVNLDHIVGELTKPERKRGRPAKPVDEDVAVVKAILKGRRA
jgi:hypothetical protein